MLDLKTIKNITIAEGSVTKITDSSGVVLWQKVVAPSSSLDVDLNNQWIASTKTLDGYNVYMSNSNHNVNNGYASMKFKFEGMPNFKLWINSYAESNYDYTIAWNLDVNYPTSNPSNGSTGVKAHTRGNQKDPTSISNFTEVNYANDGGEHFVVVTYRKDSSANANDDRGYVAIKLTLISTTWVVSATEFVKKDDKYYQRLNEVGTYKGGITALTGNYKEGNELAVTYKQGTADDYMVTDGKMYYKNYIYVTPKDQEINTSDYIQGDYIGEATPSMKVTYTDNSEKAFYNLTSIDQNTDSNKDNAKSVEIYDGVTSIEGNTFAYCFSLTSITIPDSVTSIGNYAFNKCSSLINITIGSGVTSIGNYAFSSCSSLTSITIPNSVTSIGNGAFGGCKSLISITLPNSVTNIRESTFENCSSLASVTIQNSNNKLAYNRNAFANISSTAKLHVPSNLLSQYQSDSSWTGAFGGGIFAIQIPAMKVTYTDNTEKTFYNLTSIEDNTDSNKANAKEVIIYDGVAAIGYQAFQACSSLTSITIPDTVTIIGSYAFYDCASLTGVTIGNGVTSIGGYAFKSCKSLTSVTISDTVTKIGSSAFSNCTSLPTVTIPGQVTFDQYSFYYCSNLASVTIEFSNYKLTYKYQLFYKISPKAKLYVPSNLVSSYQSDKNWRDAFGGGIYAIPS